MLAGVHAEYNSLIDAASINYHSNGGHGLSEIILFYSSLCIFKSLHKVDETKTRFSFSFSLIIIIGWLQLPIKLCNILRAFLRNKTQHKRNLIYIEYTFANNTKIQLFHFICFWLVIEWPRILSERIVTYAIWLFRGQPTREPCKRNNAKQADQQNGRLLSDPRNYPHETNFYFRIKNIKQEQRDWGPQQQTISIILLLKTLFHMTRYDVIAQDLHFKNAHTSLEGYLLLLFLSFFK